MSKRTRKRPAADRANPENESRNNCPKHTPIIGIKLYRWALTARGPQCRITGAYPPDLPVEIYRETMGFRWDWCRDGIPFDPVRYHWQDEKGTSNTLNLFIEDGAA